MTNPKSVEEIAQKLINTIADNCCDVCACDGGRKIWCACHRKQIIEALKDVARDCAEIAKRLERANGIGNFDPVPIATAIETRYGIKEGA